MKSLLINKIKFEVDSIFADKIRLTPQKPDGTSVARLAESIQRANLEAIDDVVGSTSEILIHSSSSLTVIKKALESVRFPKNHKPQTFELPVCFSKGTDWDSVLSFCGLKKHKVIDTLVQAPLSLSMYGFLPGFMYLAGVPEELQMPRKIKPAKETASGSFGLGGPYAGIYNLKSPAGWHVIGHIPITVFNQKDINNPTLNIGDQIQLTKISLKFWKELHAQSLSIKEFNS